MMIFMLWDIKVKSGKLSTENVLEMMEFKIETRSKEQHRETAVTDVVTVIQEVHA